MPRDPAKHLYTPVPPAVLRFQRHERDGAHRREMKRIRKALDALESILSDPAASEKDKLLARIELAGRNFKWNGKEE